LDYRGLGNTGLQVSALGFGCGSIGGLMVRGDSADQKRAVARALDAGITYFDTAAQYGDGLSEQNLGRTLRELGAWNRVVVGTKAGLRIGDRPDLAAALERSLQASLRRLGRDSVDLLQLHSVTYDDGVDPVRGLNLSDVLGGVADGMRRVIERGLTRHVGFSGLGDAGASHRILAAGLVETMQAYFNVLNPSAGFAGASRDAQDFDGIIDDASQRGVGVIAIRVLAAGAVTGSAVRAANAGGAGTALVMGGEFDLDLERAVTLPAMALEAGCEDAVELAFRFALAKPGISTVLLGFSNMAQLEDALRWAERGALAGSTVRQIVEAARWACAGWRTAAVMQGGGPSARPEAAKSPHPAPLPRAEGSRVSIVRRPVPGRGHLTSWKLRSGGRGAWGEAPVFYRRGKQ
jgi:aryl-alcohol dehydrogenase-like predicted oxidoreductase